MYTKNILTFVFCFFLVSVFGQLKTATSGNVMVGSQDSPGTANLMTKGTSELEFALNADAGNADFTYQLQGITKGQVKYLTSGGLQFLIDDTNAGSGGLPASASALMLASNKRLGVGTDSPATKLHVNGSITYVGDLINASDARLKKDIKQFDQGLNVITKLQPKTFKYNDQLGVRRKDNNEQPTIGLLAQELREIAPNLVKEFSHTTYTQASSEAPLVSASEEKFLAINESALKYVMINSIKEQQEIINTLLERLEKVEKELKIKEDVLISAEQN